MSFGPRPEKTGPECGAGQGADKNFGISTFFIKGTPLKIGRWSLLVLCNFLIRRTPRAPRVPRGGHGRGETQKSKLGFFYRRDPPKSQILRTFCYIQLFDFTQPRGSTVRQNPQKWGPIPGSLNKSWEFGGSA